MTIRDEYDAMLTKTKPAVAELLARHGLRFDESLHDMLHATLDDNPERGAFSVWMAEALAWATFARRDAEFFDAASTYIETGDDTALTTAAEYPDRFGHDGRLLAALVSFHRLNEKFEKRFADAGDAPASWPKLQEDVLRRAEKMKKDGLLPGIGIWLFCAPFKVLAVATPESWASPRALDGVVMPTGMQVERALDLLRKDKVGIAGRLVGGSGTLGDNFAEVFVAHTFQIELATLARTSVLHINGALYELGCRGTGG